MKTLTYKEKDLKKAIIEIGFEGENNRKKIQIDCAETFEEYPNAAVSMKIVPPKGSIYPKTVTREGDLVTWIVADSDVANRGRGEFQITFTDGTTVAKTLIGRTNTDRSLRGTGTPPSGVQDWLDGAEQALEDLEAAEVHQPTIGEDGYWYTWDQENGEYVKSDTKAEGHSPVLTSSKSGKTTTIYSDGSQLAQIQDGEDGQVGEVIDDTSTALDKVWSAHKTDAEITEVKSDILLKADQSKLDELALNGKYFVEGSTTDSYYTLTSGMINNSAGTSIESIVVSRSDTAYIFLNRADVPDAIYFDSTKVKVNVSFFKNNKQMANAYSSWITESPASYDAPSDYEIIGINARKLSGSFSASDYTSVLYKKVPNVTYFGNLVTIKDVENNIRKHMKCIYPDGFTSRIKPDIWFDGGFRADINADDFKISGTTEVWVATNGNDTTGDGTESKPYATITKALTTDAINIHIKEGTYTQGTHYGTGTNLGGRNVFGHGNVVLQNDSSGHYPYSSGNVYIENIIIKHGHATTGKAYHATCTGSGQTACFVNCVFRDGGENGLSVTGIDCICIGCVSYGNRLDGFNYHAKDIDGTTYIPNALEIDCVAYNNGSAESGNDSCNGSTAHEGVQIVRINGEYYSCYGGVIAEIAESYQETTVSVNYGLLVHDSTGTGTYKASFWASKNTKMYLYDCSCYGGTYDLSAIDQATIVSRRLTTGRDVPSVNEDASATVYQY